MTLDVASELASEEVLMRAAAALRRAFIYIAEEQVTFVSAPGIDAERG
ncbi:hypothetical protein ACVGOW_04440 [Pseudonocardia saturnea]